MSCHFVAWHFQALTNDFSSFFSLGSLQKLCCKRKLAPSSSSTGSPTQFPPSTVSLCKSDHVPREWRKIFYHWNWLVCDAAKEQTCVPPLGVWHCAARHSIRERFLPPFGHFKEVQCIACHEAFYIAAPSVTGQRFTIQVGRMFG
jgi:hypothetical protein